MKNEFIHFSFFIFKGSLILSFFTNIFTPQNQLL